VACKGRKMSPHNWMQTDFRNTNSSKEYLLTLPVSSALHEIISGNDNATETLQLECPK
jgi:hypothetical protein